MKILTLPEVFEPPGGLIAFTPAFLGWYVHTPENIVQ
jgi:hypothetical protein